MVPVPRNNNLDFIRTLLALGVLSFHTSQVVGVSFAQLPWVGSFIVISGYLITDSMWRSAGYLHFAWKRALRIGPAFLLSLGLVYATGHTTGRTVQGALVDWACMSLCNGGGNAPLWSLSLEEVLYAFLAFLFVIGTYRTQERSIARIALIYFLSAGASIFLPFEAMPILAMFLSFLSGSFLYVVRDRIIWNPIVALACLAAVLWMRNTAFSGEMRYAIFIGPPLAYFTLTFGLYVMPIFYRYKDLVGDPSLGIYVYHFPLLLFFYYLQFKGLHLYLATLSSTFVLAMISWHLVEKPALRLRDVVVNRDS